MTYQWIDLGNGRQVYRDVSERRAARSDLPSPMLRPDGMSDTWNPADGKHYDSKSSYERAVKAAGCEIVGNDTGHWSKKHQPPEPTGIREDIVQSMKQAGAL